MVEICLMFGLFALYTEQLEQNRLTREPSA